MKRVIALSEDEKRMRQAIQQAEKGVSGASPNPLVGSVIVKNGKVVGEGTHALFGGPHAEINALKKAGKNSIGATLYTNLEPCCHWGKTGPCTDAIIHARIRRVVAGILDPNPFVKGNGLKQLKEAGVTVSSGVCQSECRDLNRAFIKFVTQRKPYVILKSAISLDGKISTNSGESQWISSVDSRDFSYRLRTQVDGILVGAETLRRDNPTLTSHRRGRNPVRIVLTTNGNFPLTSKVFNREAPTWIFHTQELISATVHSHKIKNGAEWIYLKSKSDGKINFTEMLKTLAKRGISKLLIEGGGMTIAEALESGECDELFFFIAPILIGGRDAKTPFEGQGFKRMEDAIQLTKVVTRMCGRDLLIHARISSKISKCIKY